MAELLIEILCEEIPAKLQKNALEQTRQLFSHLLDEHKLTFNKDNLKTFISPRRITIVVENLSKTSKDMVEEKRGPKTTAALPAIKGFLKANNLNSVEELVVQNDYYFAHLKTPPQPCESVIPKVLEAFFANFKWSKSMQWGQGSQSWIRPIRNILCVFDGIPIEYYFEKLELTSNNKTFGHRFLSDNKCLEVKDFNDYQQQLKNHHVIFDQNERKKIIESKLQKLADAKNLLWQKDDDLLEEVVGLTEHPCVEICKIDEKFLELPPIVITTCMKNHQKYFSFADANNQSITHFGIVSNVSLNDKKLAGFTKVLKARLTDALFFYHQDLKTPLINLLPKLDNIQFYEKLGSVGDKIRRIKEFKVNNPIIELLINLYKCDLVTNIVGEFPELQGKMVSIYCGKQDASSIVNNVSSLFELIYSRSAPKYYCPPHQNDKSHANHPDAAYVYILDRIDTLVGFLGIGVKPTGSKDPFALGRIANEIAEIVVKKDEFGYYFDLNYLIKRFKNLFEDNEINKSTITLSNDTEGEVWNLLKTAVINHITRENDKLKNYEKKKSLILSCLHNTEDLFEVVKKYNSIETGSIDNLELVLNSFRRCSGILINKSLEDYKWKYYDLAKMHDQIKSNNVRSDRYTENLAARLDLLYREVEDIKTNQKYFEENFKNKSSLFVKADLVDDVKPREVVYTTFNNSMNNYYKAYLDCISNKITPTLNDFLDNVKIFDPNDKELTEKRVLLLVFLKKLMLEFYDFTLLE